MNQKTMFGYSTGIIAGFMFGMIPVISGLLRDQAVSSLEQVFFRLVIPFLLSLLVLIWYWFHSPDLFHTSLQFSLQRDFLLQGVFMTFMIISYLSSIALHTPAGEAALLTQIHPFLTLFLGWLLLHERITKTKLLSLGIAIFSVLLILQPWEWNSFLTSLHGDLLAMANGLFYALYLILGRKSSDSRVDLSSFLSITWVLFWSFLVGYPILLFFSSLPLSPSLVRLSYLAFWNPKVFVLGIGLALFGSYLPYGLLMITATYIESSKTSILVLGEPVGALLFGFLLLGEPITWNYVAGGIILGVSIYLIMQDAHDDE